MSGWTALLGEEKGGGWGREEGRKSKDVFFSHGKEESDKVHGCVMKEKAMVVRMSDGASVWVKGLCTVSSH
jgi:hypothetical protein